MGSITVEAPRPWIETPLIPSAELSKVAGCNIYLKLDLLQPSGSFKSRGIGHMMSLALSRHPSPGSARFFSSSGGNAGLACATTAAALGRPATIVVPMTTTGFMVGKLRRLGAEVVQVGDSWAEADRHLRDNLLGDGGVYVPPFDHPDIWSGVASVVDEIHAQAGGLGIAVDAIVCSVGGGGLLCGIMEGIARHKWAGAGGPPKVLAMETAGADSLSQSVAAGKQVTLPGISSIATSLGATRVADRTFEWGMSDRVACGTVTDGEAAAATVSFADDARLLVEVACGAAIAPVYTGRLRLLLGWDDAGGVSDEEWRRKNVVLEVCGGSNIGVGVLRGYMEMVGL